MKKFEQTALSKKLDLRKDEQGRYLLNTTQLAYEAFQRGYEYAQEEQDSNLTCDHCVTELGMDDGSIRLCGGCHEKHEDKWISVKDKLPNEDCDEVIVCEGDEVFSAQFSKEESAFALNFEDDNVFYFRPTHWQPLPNPPGDK